MNVQTVSYAFGIVNWKHLLICILAISTAVDVSVCQAVSAVSSVVSVSSDVTL